MLPDVAVADVVVPIAVEVALFEIVIEATVIVSCRVEAVVGVKVIVVSVVVGLPSVIADVDVVLAAVLLALVVEVSLLELIKAVLDSITDAAVVEAAIPGL